MRIISLCPSITETLFEMGAGEQVAGITRYCTRPREAVRGLARVGGTKTVDLEKIRRLSPDLIFCNAEENRREDIEFLKREFRIHVSFPKTVADAAALIREFGSLLGAQGPAEVIAEAIGQSARSLLTVQKQPFRYACFIWKDPWMTISGDTYMADLFRHAGGINVFAEATVRYPEVTADEVRRAAPDLLIFPSEPYRFSERQRPEIETALAAAVPLFFAEGDDCCWHGARTRQGLKLMEKIALSRCA